MAQALKTPQFWNSVAIGLGPVIAFATVGFAVIFAVP